MKQNVLISQVTAMIRKRLSSKDIQVFIFGSVLRKKWFRDVDIGVMGKIDETALSLLREDFEESNFPYIVDIVDFSLVDSDFKQRVFADKVVWLEF